MNAVSEGMRFEAHFSGDINHRSNPLAIAARQFDRAAALMPIHAGYLAFVAPNLGLAATLVIAGAVLLLLVGGAVYPLIAKHEADEPRILAAMAHGRDPARPVEPPHV